MLIPERLKARELSQHGVPPGWLEERYSAGCGLVLSVITVHAAYPDRPHHFLRSGADLLLSNLAHLAPVKEYLS
jgi:hypothetical protein